MPTSVKIAVAVAALLAIDNFVATAGAFSAQGRLPILPVIRLLITVVIVGALVNKSRLAWQWGRVVGTLSAIWSLFILYFLVSGNDATTLQIVSLSLSAALGLAMAFALEGTAARNYFGLICPQCASDKMQAADFWFQTAKCRKCNAKF